MRRTLTAAAVAVVVALTMACGWPPPKQPPPCHRHHYCATPTSPKPATVTTHHKRSVNHCHYRLVISRTVVHFWRWDTKLCKWVECTRTTIAEHKVHHPSRCGKHHKAAKHKPAPKAGTTTTCSVKADCKP